MKDYFTVDDNVIQEDHGWKAIARFDETEGGAAEGKTFNTEDGPIEDGSEEPEQIYPLQAYLRWP